MRLPTLPTRWRWPALSILVLLLALAGYGIHAILAPAPQAYETTELGRGDIRQTVASSGTISPLITVQVGSQVSGQVTEVDVDFNSKVRQGQLLAVVDPSTFRSKVQAAEADLAVQRAAVGSNEVQLANAGVILEQAQRDYTRTKSLADQGLLSVNDLEKARNAREQADNDRKIAAAALNTARAQLVKIESQLEQARIDLKHTEIRAPVDGVVIDREVDVGQTVQSAMTVATLFRIARDLSQVQIETRVDEADIGAVRGASGASFTVDAYPERVFRGRIAQVRVNGNATANVVTYSVMVQADNPEQLLLPGMTANVELLVAERTGVPRLPSAALRFHPGATGRGGAQGERAPGGEGKAKAAAPLPELTPALMASLGLSAAQQAAASAALHSVAARERASAGQADSPLNSGGPGPGFRRLVGDARDPADIQRQRTVNALAAVLTPAQLQQYLMLGKSEGAHAARVYVLARGRPEPRIVHVGLADDNYTEVIDGLAPGEPVIVRARAPARS
jgi:HlyD family secretion protein